MNSHKEWLDARVGNSSQNVEIKESLNFKPKWINFKCLYLRCYCDLSEQMKVPDSVSMYVIRYGIGMLQLQIFGNGRIGNFKNSFENV